VIELHKSAFNDAKLFREKYLNPEHSLQIADIGSQDINGSLKPLFLTDNWHYTGFDISPGKNVDVVLPSEYQWTNLPDASFDVVVSSQCLEHVRHPWKWMKEVSRICRPGGLIYICTPHTIPYHPYPIDCWRVYPDGMRSLFEESGVSEVSVYKSGIDTTGIGMKLPHLQQTHEMSNHFFVIRSVYSSSYPLDANKNRLDLTHRYCATSLSYQSNKNFKVAVLVSEDDPLLEERQQVFRSVGVPVLFLSLSKLEEVPDHRQHNTCDVLIPELAKRKLPFDFPTLQTRLDDDDVIAVDFVERLQSTELQCGKSWLSFPLVLMFTPETSRLSYYRIPQNQFLTRVCGSGQDSHVYSQSHPSVPLTDIHQIDKSMSVMGIYHRNNASSGHGRFRTACQGYRNLAVSRFPGIFQL